MQRVATAWTLLKRPRGIRAVLTLKLLSQKRLRPLVFAWIDLWERSRSRTIGVADVPPAALRYRVHGDLDLDSFLGSGQQTLADIERALEQAGTNRGAFRRILDFGCGCGRTLLWLSSEAGTAEVHAADVDAEAVSWCRRHLPNVTCTVNDPLPPLPYPAETFDLVYAISVFTHLDETYQFRWLDELRRIVVPQGYVLVTVHGRYYWDTLPPQHVAAIQTTGVVTARNPAFMDGFFPDWYQTTYHSPEYVTARYAEYFDVVTYIPSGLDACQDIVLLQKR